MLIWYGPTWFAERKRKGKRRYPVQTRVDAYRRRIFIPLRHPE
ncbi:hypothetical protein [Salipiger mucosus]|uniref:Uncharacterized protein n=1 Tax=Salipiger mucosus DSM 16094 TaxID=1123237 RepID=S9RFA1_9RHOB|nr:hypothetical protein [Salipiger mucosus]EPX76790.1 hypothetical protein Salmuc_04676 [Salipiger mucosus DSM 16094]